MSDNPIARITNRIVQSYRDDGGINRVGGLQLPARSAIVRIILEIEELCFPGFLQDVQLCEQNLEYVTGNRVAMLLDAITAQMKKNLAVDAHHAARAIDPTALEAEAIAFATAFLEEMPNIRRALQLDVTAMLSGDPAARSREEIILAYPGIRAILVHRVAHHFWQRGARLIARMMSEHMHSRTGIDIHPGARIGQHFYIDHGTGIVIGETTTIGEHVKLYQGVSLGALSVSAKMKDHKRHPTLEDHVTIYAGATILGGETVVGHHTVVGGNVWLVKSVPPYSVVEHEALVRVGSKADRAKLAAGIGLTATEPENDG